MTIAAAATVLFLAGLALYLAGRHGLFERRSGDMEEAVSDLRAVRATLERSERALRRSEARHRSLLQHAPFGVFRCREDGRIVAANRALAEILGCASTGDVIGQVLPRDLYDRREDWQELVDSLEQAPVSPSIEVAWRRVDGSPIRVRTRYRIVTSKSGRKRALHGFVEDVTERQQLEDRLRQAQKMEAVGQLAGGVAHDFNNLLTIVLTSCELLLLEDGHDEQARDEIEEIQKAARKATGLTQQLLAFSRQQPLAPEVLQPNRAVTDMLKLLGRTLGEHVELETHLDPECGWVRVDPSQLQQVLLNLTVNARDAMPAGGTVTISTRPAVFDSGTVEDLPGSRPGEYVALSVTDNGTGMPPDTLDHLFEPFFTTKELGRGTGLGLATVYGIVKQSEGYIDVRSEVGEGSTFTVFLPRAAAPESHDVEAVTSKPEGGCETVLVVEDEAPLRALVSKVLAKAGYALLEAEDGEEAVRLADAHEGRIDVLLTDVVMPRKSGPEVARHLERTRCGMKVLYMSGYIDDVAFSPDLLENGHGFLKKPFTPASLLSELRTVLDAPTPVRAAAAP